MPHHFQIYKAFAVNLEKLGYNIELLYTSNHEFKYKNTSQKITNFFRKTFLGDKKFKQSLKDNFDSEQLLESLAKITTKVDYALVIRPDCFSAEALQVLKSKTDQLVAYQWDGLDRYPKVKELIPHFDRFFLFDVDDFKTYNSTYPNIFPITNFYFDYETEISSNNINKEPKEVFFIGSFIENRIDEIVHLTKIFKDLKLKININVLVFNNKSHLKYLESGITFTNEQLTYLQALEKVKNTDVVLDFADSVHNGLSLRIFETLKYSKKLITTNKLVKNYDFYSPDNILVWDKTVGQEEIKQFLGKDYQNLDKEILYKYSFTNWIKTILQK